MTQIKDILSSNHKITDNLQEDLDRYINQGGLLGIFTYFLLYLETENDELASTAASIPISLFVMSSLHDDAIDEANEHDGNLKQFLNMRTTLGDQLFTHVVDFTDTLPEQFDVNLITSQFREIATGQLREEEITMSALSTQKAIKRVEERGSVWGELAVSPVEAGNYYTDEQLDYVYTLFANLLFVLTVVDDVEDIPEDLGNDVMNIPLLLYRKEIEEYESKESLIEALIESDVPQRLDDLCTKREQEIEVAARAFADDSTHSKEAMLAAWNQALDWYQNNVCTVPVKRTVPQNRQAEIHATLSSDDSEKREEILEQVTTDFPMRLESTDEFVDAVSTLRGTHLSPAVIMMSHIEELVESVMTTNLEDAFENLRAQTTEN